jgi:hypothetical protein
LHAPANFFDRNNSPFFGSFDSAVNRRERGFVFLVQDGGRALGIKPLRVCHAFTVSRIDRERNSSRQPQIVKFFDQLEIRAHRGDCLSALLDPGFVRDP